MREYIGPARFVSGDQLRLHLRTLIEGATTIDIATAWLTQSDTLRLIENVSHHAIVRIVIGVSGFATSPSVLRRLRMNPAISTKVVDNGGSPLFHPKLYVLRRHHWRRMLIGSMNFTHAGISTNIESLFSFEDRTAESEREFNRFWHVNHAVNIQDFDVSCYEERRRGILDRLKQSGVSDILDQEVLVGSDAVTETDFLREGWQEYFGELSQVPRQEMQHYLDVLEVRTSFVNRVWSEDFNDFELDLMYGTTPYFAFGDLRQAKQHSSKVTGSLPEHKQRRVAIGTALRKALTLQSLQNEGPIAEGIVRSLYEISGVGAAVLTRLLVLVRPDFFVVVNEKSINRLRERFG